MASKNISLDTDAYNRLRRAKKPHESFSQTIKRIVPKPVNMDRWLKSLNEDPFSEEFVKGVELQVAGRLSRTRRRR